MKTCWPQAILIALIGLGLPGCKRTALPGEMSQALREGTEFELISLDPMDNKDSTAPDRLNTFLILGRTTMVDKETRDALVRSIEHSTLPRTVFLACIFEPRHVVRVKHKGESFDFLICFACGELNVNKGGKRAGEFLFDRKDKNLFNKVFADAGLKLAPQ